MPTSYDPKVEHVHETAGCVIVGLTSLAKIDANTSFTDLPAAGKVADPEGFFKNANGFSVG